MWEDEKRLIIPEKNVDKPGYLMIESNLKRLSIDYSHFTP